MDKYVYKVWIVTFVVFNNKWVVLEFGITGYWYPWNGILLRLKK